MNNQICGIYQIRNFYNNKRYIGFSKDIERRFEEHKNSLDKNKHYNIYLQRSWNKYGENAFDFEIIEECENDKNFLAEREIYWEQEYRNQNLKLYNIEKCGKGGDSFTNNPNKEEICKKISKSKLGKKIKPFTEEHKRKIGLKSKGRIFTEETRQKMSINRKGKKIPKLSEWYKNHESPLKNKKYSEETREKLREIQLGHEVTKETREKLRIANLGKKRSEESKQKQSMSGKGYIIINKDNKEKHAKPEDLQSYLNQGWIIGQTEEHIRKNKISNTKGIIS